MADIAKLNVVVGAETDKAQRKLGGFSSKMRKGVAGAARIAGGALAAAGAGAAAFGVKAFNAASDANEALNKTRVVFGDASKTIEDFADTAADSFGISEAAALEIGSTFGNLFTNMGIGEQAAADMSEKVLTLGSDLASFNNIVPEEALERLRSGLVGETEPLKQMGILLNEAAIKAQLAKDGNDGLTGSALEAAKVQARYALILEQTGKAQGDFARTAEDPANALRRLQAKFQDVAAAAGQALLPAVGKIFNVLGGLIEKVAPVLGELASSLAAAVLPIIEPLGEALGELGEALVPVAKLLGRMLEALAPLLPVIAKVAAIIVDVLLAAIEPLVEPIARVVEAIADALMPVLDALAPVLTEIAEEMGDVLGDVLIQIADIIVELLPPLSRLLEAVIPLLPAFVKLQTALLPLLEPLLKLVSLLVEKGLVPVIDALAIAIRYLVVPIEWFANAIEAAVDWLVDFFTNIDEAPEKLGAIADAIGGFFADAGMALQDAGAAIIEWFKNLPGVIVDAISQLPSLLGEAAGKALRGYIEIWKRLPGLILDVFTWVLEAYKTGFSWIWTFVTETVPKIANWIIDQFKKIPKWIGTIGTWIIEKFVWIFTELPRIAAEQFAKIWNNTVGKLEDILKWLREAGGKFWNALKSIGSSIWDGFKSGLGIGSPSLVERAMDALTENFVANTATVKAAAGDLGRTFASTTGAHLEATARLVPDAAGGLGMDMAMAAGAAAGGATIVNNYTTIEGLIKESDIAGMAQVGMVGQTQQTSDLGLEGDL